MGVETWEKLPVGHWRHGAIIGVGRGIVAKWGWMDGAWEWRTMQRIQYQHADAKMQMRGWDECCLWECGAVNVPSYVRKNAMPRRSKMWCCQRMPKVCQYSTVWTVGARGAENAKECPSTIAHRRGGCAQGCTSLPCTSVTVHTPCPVKTRVTGFREQNGDGME